MLAGEGLAVHMKILAALKCATMMVVLTHLTGCVTNSSNEIASQDTAANAFAAVPPKPGFGVAYVGRPSDRNASLFPVPIELDGRPLASVGLGKYVRVELPPGSHVIGARDDWWSHAINGKPYPASLTVEPGKVYYLLPKRWLGEPRNNLTIIGNAVVPHQTVAMEGTFSVQVSPPDAPPPPEFLSLTPTEAQQSR